MGRIEVNVLKAFSRFVVSFDVQNGFIFEYFSLEHHCVKENIFIN